MVAVLNHFEAKERRSLLREARIEAQDDHDGMETTTLGNVRRQAVVGGCATVNEMVCSSLPPITKWIA